MIEQKKERERERKKCENREKKGSKCERYKMVFQFPFPEYKTDPYSDGNPMETICSRGDLLERPEGGGCYDTKVNHDHELCYELFTLIS